MYHFSMYSVVDSLCAVSLLTAFISNRAGGVRFSAVTLTADSYQRHLYLQEWNQGADNHFR